MGPVTTLVWFCLIAAFCVGLGLGWWLFADTAATAPATSATVARARLDADPTHTLQLADLRADLDAARQRVVARESELATARAAHSELQSRLVAERQAAEQLRDAHSVVRKELSTLKTTHAALQEAHSTLTADHRALRESHRALREERDREPARASTPTAPPRPVQPPRADVSTADAPTAEPEEARTAPVAPRPSPLSSAHPIVLFGALTPVPLTPTARSIPWEVTVRPPPDAPPLHHIEVVLRYDLEDEGISINGRRRGPVHVARDASATHARPLQVPVSVSTGLHSDRPEAARPPAVPGQHQVVVEVRYRPGSPTADEQAARFRALVTVAPND